MDRRDVAKVRTKDGKRWCSRRRHWCEPRDFPRNASTSDGLALYCRACKREANKTPAVDLRGEPPAEEVSASRPRRLTPAAKAAPAKTKRRPGIPSTITPALIREICTVLSRGHSRRVAARRNGILEDTLAQWMHRGGEAKSGPVRDLYEAVLFAEGDGEFNLVEGILNSAARDPNDAKWVLERRYSAGLESWVRKEQLAVAGGDKPLEVSIVRELVSKRLDAFDVPANPLPAEPPPAPAPPPGPAPEAAAPAVPAEPA